MSIRTQLLFLLSSFFFALLQLTSSGQDVNVERKNFSFFFPSYSLNIPSFDMKDRYGLSHTVGAGYSFMFKNGFVLSADGNYMFGKNIRNSADLFRSISTKEGNIIDQSGTSAQILLSERGFTLWIKMGKLIPFNKSNLRSGLLLMSGIGLMQHKIRIDVSQNTAPQLRNDYKKGYDHLCNGPAINEFIGYQHVDKAKRINFFAGFDFSLAWTQSRRAYYFSEMTRPNEKRFDMLSGIKIGWVVPISRKSGKEYYYY